MATMTDENNPNEVGRNMNSSNDFDPGYNDNVDAFRGQEFPMLKDTTYLDHAGTTLYPKTLIEDFLQDMTSNLLGNPHSASSSSQLSTRRTEDVRLRVLRFFNADPDHFDLIFVANATAGIKLVMEGFREREHGFWYGYHKDSHTSLVGVREVAKVGHRCFATDQEVEDWLHHHHGTIAVDPKNHATCLLAYPAQSNMDGRRLPLDWASQVRVSKHDCYSLLDAAALVSTSPLDLSNASKAPDFTVLSFYKIFGFPDLGALIVRKATASVLGQRTYFGGGTVDMVTCGKENWHVRKQGSLHEQLEDGTLPVHSIIALDSALRNHQRLFQSPARVACHTAYLADYLYDKLMLLRHPNGNKVCEIYKVSSSSYRDTRAQGPIIALNLRTSRGDWFSNTEVEKLANIRNIQLRSGGLCNPGGIASSLELEPWEMKRNFSAGHRCGNENDIIGGKPTGMLRVSLGAMSNMKDVVTFFEFVHEFFVEREDIAQSVSESRSPSHDLYVETLTVYPIKSCGGWPVPTDMSWDIRDEGLAWDREWCLVHQGTRTALSQKRYPRMALLRPVLELDSGLLYVRYHGPVPPGTPHEISVPLSADPSVFQCYKNGAQPPYSEVCGENVVAQLYASPKIATFFTDLVGTPCTLARFPTAAAGLSTRHSKANLNTKGCAQILNARQRPLLLSNESPILTVSRSSVNRLNEQIKVKDGKAAHASVFRANIILAEDPALCPGSERPYVEDEWRSLLIGDDVKLDVLGGCHRCQMVCVDQNTAERNEEPFVTLAKTRRREGKVFFGVHTALSEIRNRTTTRVKIGDKVVASTE